MLLYILYYPMIVCVMAWFPVAVLIVVPYGAKMCRRPPTVTTPNRRISPRRLISVRFSNISLMDANSAAIFSMVRIGGMAVVTGQSLVVRGQARYNGLAGRFRAKRHWYTRAAYTS